MTLGLTAGWACIVVLLALIVAIALTPRAPDDFDGGYQ